MARITRAGADDARRDAHIRALAEDEHPTDTDLVPLDDEIPTATIMLMAELAEAVSLAEMDRQTDMLSYEQKAGIALIQAITDLKKRRWADHQTADRESLLRIKRRVDAWVAQVGIREDGGS